MRPLGGLAVLALPFVVLILVWTARAAPVTVCSGDESGDRDRWLAGLAPAAFAAGCYLAAVILWLSARTREGDPSGATVVAVAGVLVAAGLWWAGGETVGYLLLWPLLAYFLLIPSVILVPGLIVAMVVSREPRAWQVLQALAWWSALVLLPGFVGVIDLTGLNLRC